MALGGTYEQKPLARIFHHRATSRAAVNPFESSTDTLIQQPDVASTQTLKHLHIRLKVSPIRQKKKKNGEVRVLLRAIREKYMQTDDNQITKAKSK